MYIFNTSGKFAKLKPQIDGFKKPAIISINFFTAYSGEQSSKYIISMN